LLSTIYVFDVLSSSRLFSGIVFLNLFLVRSGLRGTKPKIVFRWPTPLRNEASRQRHFMSSGFGARITKSGLSRMNLLTNAIDSIRVSKGRIVAIPVRGPLRQNGVLRGPEMPNDSVPFTRRDYRISGKTHLPANDPAGTKRGRVWVQKSAPGKFEVVLRTADCGRFTQYSGMTDHLLRNRLPEPFAARDC